MPVAGELLNLQITGLMDYALNDNALKAAVGIATINALSAILFEDAAKIIHLIGEAGSGYDFFENCAEKIIISHS